MEMSYKKFLEIRNDPDAPNTVITDNGTYKKSYIFLGIVVWEKVVN